VLIASLSIFAVLINLNYLIYSESLLLCLTFILFFLLIYCLIKGLFKAYVFLKIFKNYFLILVALKLNYCLNKFFSYFHTITYNFLIKYKDKITFLKKTGVINIKKLLNYYNIILNLVYFLIGFKNIKLKIYLDNLIFLIDLKNNDIFLFF
jgi:hypothetical protein